MTTSLRTSSAIKRALAEEYAYLVATFDPKHRERQATNAIKKRLAPWQCAACGRRPPEVERLEAAHIAPLAECAETTPQNLVLLCKEPRAKPPGCHTLFDSGCASIDEMDACRESWTAGRSSVLRDRMLLVFQQHGPRPHQQGHLTKELTNLRAQRNSLSVTSPQWHDVQLSIAEVTRRRARRDALSGALHEIEVPLRAGLYQLVAWKSPASIHRFRRGQNDSGSEQYGWQSLEVGSSYGPSSASLLHNEGWRHSGWMVVE
jgi:hypothetical protein